VGYSLRAPELLFRKIEDEEIAAELAQLQANATAKKTTMENTNTEKSATGPNPLKPEIVFDDFAKIDLRVGNFNNLLPAVLNELTQVDLAFIDGNHTYEATINYFNLLLQKTHYNSVLIFDDIYWSKGMTKAWEEIKHHPKVTVTVDLFYIGLVYFRTQQAEEHFKLRVL
jgi:hypothetical protein